jgi:hypothetical protein
MESYFINHTKNVIVGTHKAASKNISKYLCEAVKDNCWSITDHIEFVDVKDKQNDKLIRLIEENYYYCELKVHQTFYNN